MWLTTNSLTKLRVPLPAPFIFRTASDETFSSTLVGNEPPGILSLSSAVNPIAHLSPDGIPEPLAEKPEVPDLAHSEGGGIK